MPIASPPVGRGDVVDVGDLAVELPAIAVVEPHPPERVDLGDAGREDRCGDLVIVDPTSDSGDESLVSCKQALVTIALCFGLGFGLTSTVSTAHACSCSWGESWELELEAIDGDGDPTNEMMFWSPDAAIRNTNIGAASLHIGSLQIKLERIQ